MTRPCACATPAAATTGSNLADVLLALGDLMRDCHRESLALQDAISRTLPRDPEALSRLQTYQQMDHVTQVHADLARLLPELAKAVVSDDSCIDHLSDTLRLVSLRDRLFGQERAQGPLPPPGEVSFF
ncbi:MAG: hypothetical protein RIE24_25870 [Silicimonas sp.]